MLNEIDTEREFVATVKKQKCDTSSTSSEHRTSAHTFFEGQLVGTKTEEGQGNDG